MKKIIYSVFSVCMVMTMFTSCDNSDEVVPLEGFNMTSSTYRRPDPTLLNGQEQAEVDAIRDEYYSNVPQ
jgi:hypothetical protein